MTYPRVEIRVDGQHGVERRSYSTGQELVRRADGFHGADAPSGKNGKNGGSIRVELRVRQGGGLVAFDTDTGGSQQVCVGEDLYLSAKGGDGEDGGTGGDGRTGSTGYNGQSATQHSEATRGGDGGPGGNAGRGSSGGDGGHGGTVEVRLSEYNMHIAYVAGWDVRGGSGGRKGQHGRAGEGGRGGRGGRGCSWQEFDGYKQVCASDCGYGTSSAVTRSGSSSIGPLRSGMPLHLAIQNGAISDGENTYALNNIGARIPASHAGLIRNALNSSSNNQALIQSSSSGALATMGHSSGCGQVAKYKTRSRPSASNGRDGPRGWAPTSPLYSGTSGDPGRATVIVYSNPYIPTSDKSYTSTFEFRLRDFDVADENHDDVFEPGEYALISGLQVENANTSQDSMPTPIHTEIPAELKSCAWLQRVPERGTVSLPRNIAPRQTKTTTDGTIWAKIIAPPRSSITNQTFIAHQQIQLGATIPDIDRPVNNFNFSKVITIRYPLFFESGQIKYLESIPFGSSCSIKWPISNCSSRDLGSDTPSRRQVKSGIETESRSAILGNPLIPVNSIGTGLAEEDIVHIGAYQTLDTWKRVHITEDAEEYSKIVFLIQLRATPVTSMPSQHLSSQSLIPMQIHEIAIQVTNRYHHGPDSKFLILTSKATNKECLDGWRRFLRMELHATADVWNVSQYGGIREQDGTSPVLDKYAGKTILALDDPFQSQDAGQRSVIDFVEAETSHALLQKQISFIFTKQCDINQKSTAAKLKEIAWAAARLGDIDGRLQSVALRTSSKKELLELLNSRTKNPTVYILDDSSNLERHGRRLARRLRRLHPRDRFIVTDNMDGSGLVVLQCNPQGQNFSVISVRQRKESNETISGLSLTEAYTLVASLPFLQRLDILHSTVTARQTYSDFVSLAAKHSAMHDLHNQVACLASRPRWSHTLTNFRRDCFTTNSTMSDSHDKVAMLLSHDICRPTRSSQGCSLPGTPLELLSSVINSARCQNIPQLLTKLCNPFRRTRSHVKRGLLSQVKDLIQSIQTPSESAQAKDQFQAFKKRVRQKLTNKSHGNTISKSISALTEGQVRPNSTHSAAQTYTIDSIFPKSLYVTPQELADWRTFHKQAEAQHRSDRALIASLAAALDLEVHDETRSPPPSATHAEPTSPLIPRESGVQERTAGEVAATPVSAPLEMHASTTRPVTLERGNRGTTEEQGQPGPVGGVQGSARSSVELMSTSRVSEMPHNTRPTPAGPTPIPLVSELPHNDPTIPAELMSTSLVPELPGEADSQHELPGRDSRAEQHVPAVDDSVTVINQARAFVAMFLTAFQG